MQSANDSAPRREVTYDDLFPPYTSPAEVPGWYRVHSSGRKRRIADGRVRELSDLWADTLEYARALAQAAYIDIMVGTTPDPVVVSLDGAIVGAYGARGWEDTSDPCPGCGGGNDFPCVCGGAR